MKKNSLSVLLAASLLAFSASACGTDSEAPSGQEAPDPSPAEDEAAADTETDTKADTEETAQNADNTESPEETDIDVTNNDAAAPGESADASRVSVSFTETRDEIKAEDGTVLLENSVSMPVVAIEGGDEIAAKINADIEAYYAFVSSDDSVIAEMSQSDYEASRADENGGWFHGYTLDLSVNVTRMDDAVLSLELISYAYTGGAHGNHRSFGKNYSIRTGEPITLEDLSEDPSAFHAAALDYIVNLAETPAYSEKLFDPSKEELDSTLFQESSWIFTQSGLSFFSDPYALSPFVFGEIYFMLPYEKAYELGLKEEYRYNGNFMVERYYTSQHDPDTMGLLIDGKPEYSFDLNGDGTEEGIAFYGVVHSPEGEGSKVSLYIDGKDWGDVPEEQIDASNGYYAATYALYDRDPSDGLTEIAVLFTELGEDNSESGVSGSRSYTYLFRYTADKELEFTERLDGYVTNPLSSL